MPGRIPVGKITKHAEMLRLARSIERTRSNPAYAQQQLAPHERPPRPTPPTSPFPLTPSPRTLASSSSSSDPLAAFVDPRPALAQLFRLPLSTSSPPRAWTKELALQMVTHPSTPEAQVGTAPHNAKLAFYGRRLLALHFQTFLSNAARQTTPEAIEAGGGYTAVIGDLRRAGPASAQRTSPGDGTPEGLERAILDEAVLGRYVGYRWQVKEWANWGAERKGYDTRGSLVQSAFGGVGHAFGAPASQRLFLTFTLPFLAPLLPAWLQTEVVRQAERVKLQGGVWGPVKPEGEGEEVKA